MKNIHIIIKVTFVAVALLGTVAGFFLLSRSQDIRQQASTGSPTYRSCAQGVQHGQTACSGFREVVTCRDGAYVDATQCPSNQVCQQGQCVGQAPRSCAGNIPDGGTSCSDTKTLMICRDGAFQKLQDCDASQICANGQCNARPTGQACGSTPDGEFACQDSVTLVQCRNGQFVSPAPCGAGKTCRNAKCESTGPSPVPSPIPSPSPRVSPLVAQLPVPSPSPSPSALASTKPTISPKPSPSPVPSPSPTLRDRPVSIPCCLNGKTVGDTTSCRSSEATFGICSSDLITTSRASISPTPSSSPQSVGVPCCLNGRTQYSSLACRNPDALAGSCSSQSSLADRTPIQGQSLSTPNLFTSSPQPQSLATNGTCFYGTSSCTLINRYSATGCSMCGSSYSACCGSVIPASSKICTPYASSCSGPFTVELCNSTGTSTSTITCAEGTLCRNSRCTRDTCNPGTCIDGLWCGKDGLITSLRCDRAGQSCGSIPNNTCHEGSRCIDGHMWAGEGCPAVQPSPTPRVASAQCFYGSRSCAALGRYTATACSSSCSPSYAACCGDIIPTSSRVCNPSQGPTCTNNRVQVCRSDGTGFIEQNCEVGMTCQDGRCVRTGGEVCQCQGIASNTDGGNPRLVSLREGQESVFYPEDGGAAICHTCLKTSYGCSIISQCNVTAVAASNESGQAVNLLQSTYPTVTFYGQGDTVNNQTAYTISNSLSYLPPELYDNSTIIIGPSGTGGGVNYGGGNLIKLGSPGCEGEGAQYYQNPDVQCGYGMSAVIHEVLHSNDDVLICESGTEDSAECQTRLEAFVAASAQDGVHFSTETEESHVHNEDEDFLLYSQYNTNSGEGFAISGAAYVLAPDQLRETQPNVYAFYRDHVFEGQEYIEILNADCTTTNIILKTPESEAMQRAAANRCGT